ncbi:MAG: GNAT family N-acetyltransferase [Lachnospiraceae bacterium]|jgi:RimJ/RimL family protein N-acetyltransferase|nr:GNAT family N-acetyltransferase [Lachnospiraceae bacterium]
MKIDNSILKHYLRNVMFITGTAYAGKSTMVAMLAEKYGLVRCGENYHSRVADEIIVPERQPNLCYFKTMNGWQEFLNRTPEEYEKWIQGCSQEAAEFEIAELIYISQNKKVIADTNIPLDILHEIAGYHQVAVMLSPQEMSVEKFFDRDDPDKIFIREQIMQSKFPQKTMENFKACLAKVNSKENYDQYARSGFFTLVRTDAVKDTKDEVLRILSNHFGLGQCAPSIYISSERLYIRPFEEKDFLQFQTLLDLCPGWQLQKNNVRPFFEWHLSNYNRMDIEHGHVCFGIFLKESDALIGTISLNEHDDLHVPEMGYGILEDYRGKGYAKEASKAVLTWAKSYFDIKKSGRNCRSK